MTVLHRLDWRHRMRFAPFQRPGMPESAGLTYEQCEQSVWAVLPDGHAVSSAHAASVALSQLTILPVPLWVYFIPGIRQIEEAAYRWVARHRSSFPGMKPYCDRHPEDCGNRR